MIAFLLDTWHGWPFLTLVVVLGLIVAVALTMGIGAIVAIFSDRQARAEYERQYARNLQWLQQRGRPTEIEEFQHFLGNPDGEQTR